MENFVLPIFAAIRRNWTKIGQKQDGIRTGKNARKRDSQTRLLSRRDCKKCRETFSLTPVHRMEGMETERSGAHGAKARYRRSDLRGRAPDKSALKNGKTGRPVSAVLFYHLAVRR